MRYSGQAIGGVLASAQASVGRGVKRDFNQWADKLTHPDSGLPGLLAGPSSQR